MKILISTTFNTNMTESKVKPFILLPEVEEILYVSDAKGPALPKVRYYCLPGWLLRATNNDAFVRAGYKFFAGFYLAFFKRPCLLMGYGFVPHGINVDFIGRVLNIPSCINMIGGAVGIEGGDFTSEKNLLVRQLRVWLGKLFSRIVKKYRLIVVTGASTKNYLVSKRGVDPGKVNAI